MPKLTVMIPVYNIEKYLPKCLDSVIYPELSDYEIVIVNDGSTDGSLRICEEYAVRYPELIRVITTENGGLGAARDIGIDNAEGEFIMFLDSDDYLSPDAFPEILEYLNRDFDMLFFDVRSVNEDGRLLRYYHGCALEGEFTLESYPELVFELPSAWNKIYRRSLFTDNDIRYPGRVWFEDMYVTPKLYTAANKMLSVHRPWHNYLQRSGSITNSKNAERNMEIIPAVNSMLEAFRDAGLFEKYHAQLEYAALYNQVITSIPRVNLIDRTSEVQIKLFEDFKNKFPDYGNNPYVKTMSRKYKLILSLIEKKMFLLLHIVMTANNKIKGKLAFIGV